MITTMKIVFVDKKEPPKKAFEPTLVGLKYGTVFSGEIKGLKGIWLLTSDGVYRLDDENPYFHFSEYTFKFNDDILETVKYFKELNATLTIENA